MSRNLKTSPKYVMFSRPPPMSNVMWENKTTVSKRSSLNYCKRFAQSAGPGSKKGPLFELIFAWLAKGSTFGVHFRTRRALWCHFWLIFRSLSALWERWEPTFSSQKRFGPPKAPRQNPQNTVTFGHPFGSHFFRFVRFFELCF